MYYPPQPVTYVYCNSYGCKFAAQTIPQAQCPFCALYYCPTHCPSPCRYCGYAICAGCWNHGRPCCAWAMKQAPVFHAPVTHSHGASSGAMGSGGYGSAMGILTDDIENAIKGQDRWPTFVDYNEGDPFDFWQSAAFPGLNVKFLIVASGALFEVHVKWNNRQWYSDEPYAMSLKVALRGSKKDLCKESRPNIMGDTHRYLWGNMLARARKVIANHYAAKLMTEFGLKNVVTHALVQTLVRAGRKSDLVALYLCTLLPLSVWEQEAWSLMLDEVQK